MQFPLIQGLAQAIARKDACTGGHVQRTANLAARIAERLPGGISSAAVERVRLAALLHDIGKIGVEDSILKKPAALDERELERMRLHPQLGYEIVVGVPGMRDVAEGVRFHHERWDGGGYPFGLKAEEIPWIARVIAVADTYDAMVSERPYRVAMTHELAVSEIARLGGTQLDPVVVQAFVEAALVMTPDACYVRGIDYVLV